MREFVVGATVALAVAVPATGTDDMAARAYRLAKAADKRARLAQATADSAGRAVVSVHAAQGVTGPQGASGDVGEPGRNGHDGANGTDGVKGAQGERGAMGPAGVGPQGASGDRGPQGERGFTGQGGPAAFGYVSATGAGTSTQGATVTHPGSGLYCLSGDLTALTVTPDTPQTEAFVYRPGQAGTSCSGNRWMVVLSGVGQDSGFTFMGQ